MFIALKLSTDLSTAALHFHFTIISYPDSRPLRTLNTPSSFHQENVSDNAFSHLTCFHPLYKSCTRTHSHSWCEKRTAPHFIPGIIPQSSLKALSSSLTCTLKEKWKWNDATANAIACFKILKLFRNVTKQLCWILRCTAA